MIEISSSHVTVSCMVLIQTIAAEMEINASR